MSSKSDKSWLATRWPTLAMYGGLFAGLGTLLFVKLDTLLPGYSAGEIHAYNASLDIPALLDNPINAPFSLLVYILNLVSDQGALHARTAAALIGLVTLMLFCWLLRRWYDTRTALFGTVLLGTSAWFLHTSRLGVPDALLFTLLVLVAAGVWLKRTRNPFVLLLCFLLAGASMYIPGMIWFVVLVAAWEWKQVDFLFKRHLWAVALGTLLFLAMITPLAWATYRAPELAKIIAGLPAQGWPSVSEILQNFIQVPLSLFLQAPAHPEVWLGRLPVLDAFATAMFALGAYLYIKHSRLGRAKLFVPVLLIGWGLVALDGGVSLSILVPFVYLIVATGVGFMIDSWLSIFPRNPIAKTIGTGLVVIAVLTACSFQFRSYFIAWPNNSETRAVFTIQDVRASDTIDANEQ